jgi:hypothetical protein
MRGHPPVCRSAASDGYGGAFGSACTSDGISRQRAHMPWKHWGSALLSGILCFSVGSSSARADAGDLTLGGSLNYQQQGYTDPIARGVEAAALLEWGLSNYAALRLQLGPLWHPQDGAFGGDLSGGLVLLWDVLQWVPSIHLSAGAEALSGTHAAPLAAHYGAALEVRRYLTAQSAVGLIYGMQRLRTGFQYTLGLALYQTL